MYRETPPLVHLDADHERALALQILRFEETLHQAAADYLASHGVEPEILPNGSHEAFELLLKCRSRIRVSIRFALIPKHSFRLSAGQLKAP